MTTTFDADAFRSNDLAAFLRTLLGPIERTYIVDVDSYVCGGCLGRSVDFSRNPDGYIDNCAACVNDALQARGLIMSYCHDCGGMQGIMPILPGQTPDEYNHVHFLPLAADDEPKPDPYGVAELDLPQTVIDQIRDLLDDDCGGAL